MDREFYRGLSTLLKYEGVRDRELRRYTGVAQKISTGSLSRARGGRAGLLLLCAATAAKVELLNCERYFMPRPISHALNNVMCLVRDYTGTRAHRETRIDIARRKDRAGPGRFLAGARTRPANASGLMGNKSKRRTG